MGLWERALGDIAAAQASTGQVAEPLATAQSFEDVERRAQALVSIAVDLPDAGLR